jgi:hypothetical protein
MTCAALVIGAPILHGGCGLDLPAYRNAPALQAPSGGLPGNVTASVLQRDVVLVIVALNRC